MSGEKWMQLAAATGAGVERPIPSHAALVGAGQGLSLTELVAISGSLRELHEPTFVRHVSYAQQVFDQFRPLGQEAIDFFKVGTDPVVAQKVLQRTSRTQPYVHAMNRIAMEIFKMRNGGKTGISVGLAHSVGEFSVAVEAGCFPEEIGYQFVGYRGRLTEEAGDENPGKLVAVVGMDEYKLAQFVRAFEAKYGLHNTPGGYSIAIPEKDGESDERTKGFIAEVKKNGAPVAVKVADTMFHTDAMQKAAKGFAPFCAAFMCKDPAFPMVMNATGRAEYQGAAVQSALMYAVDHMVRFVDCMESAKKFAEVFIPCGAETTLSTLITRNGVSAENVRSAANVQRALSDKK